MNKELPIYIRQLNNEYGYRKKMERSSNESIPNYFLHRKFLDDQDLLIIFNTRRCRYQCDFCNLPSRSLRHLVPTEKILDQFEYVANELKHSLSTINRITLSNEGSVFDTETFPRDALITIVLCTAEMKSVGTLVFETRLEHVVSDYIYELQRANPKAKIDILTGFETVDDYIRDKILCKREPMEQFLKGLDKLAELPVSLTSYVLFKPSPYFTDDEAKIEAERSIDFLQQSCEKRRIPLTIRLNPMYTAEDTIWAKKAFAYSGYQPPRLSDVLEVAKRKRAQGIQIYIGLSTENLEDPRGTYRLREDFSVELLKQAMRFNQSK